MKTLKWSLVVLVTGVGVSTVMLRTRSPGPLATNANEPTEAVERNEAVVDQLSILIFLLPLPNSDLAAEHPDDPATAFASDATSSIFPDTALYRGKLITVQTSTTEDQQI